MSNRRFSPWMGFYALLPLMAGLMVLNAVARLSPMDHSILLAGTVLVVCWLAVRWVDRHPRLVERSGAGLPCSDDRTTYVLTVRRLAVPAEAKHQSPVRHSSIDD